MAKVFIIDDDDAVRKGLSRLMTSAGLQCATFRSGPEFLAAAKGDCGCILLDYHMHGSDGPRVMASLAEAGLPIPIIILSGHDEPESRERARELGAVAYFRKPVDDQALLDAIAWALGSPPGPRSPVAPGSGNRSNPKPG